MKMKYRKKHRKQLLNFSVLILFMLILNINSTFMFKNYESKYITDNYEDLDPELVIESPKNANNFDNLDYMPYDIDIYAPEYIQRFVGQPTSNTIFFKLHDANGGWFTEIKIFVDDIEQSSFDWNGDTIDFNIDPFLTTNKVCNIKFQALSSVSHDWVTFNSILNVTPTSPCIAPFYEDFTRIPGGGNTLNWDIDALNPNYYNYSIYINDIVVNSTTNSFAPSIPFNYLSYGEFDTSLGAVNEISLEIIDETGNVTINQFQIKTVADSTPYVHSLDRNCHNIEHLTLWETEGFKIKTSAYTSQGDLGKIAITVNNLLVYTIEDAEEYEEYEAPIDINIINKLKGEYGNLDSSLEFRAIAITECGRHSEINSGHSQHMELRYHNYYPQLVEKTKDVNSGRNIETLQMSEEHNSDIKYSLTVVTDVLAPTTLTIAGSTGEAFENNDFYNDNYEEDNKIHCYSKDDGSCNLFGGFETEQGWFRGGMVFWVSVTNQSAVQFPMIVKIVYPEEMQPDEIDNNRNLQFMHWIENCETNERGWFIYNKNESIFENQDESLKDVGDNAIEVLIYSQGLYAFGIEPGDDIFYSEGFYISSFPLGLFIFSFGIAAMTISLKFKSKINKD